MILIDKEIRRLSQSSWPLLEPFSEGVQGGNVISYGLTSAGYDLRLGYKNLVFKNTHNMTISPKRFKQDPNYTNKVFDEITLNHGEPLCIPPHSYILGYTLEYIRVPRFLKGRCCGKSTLARCGIIINTTPLEPLWEGHLTLEIANVTPCPVEVYCGEGIAQLEFDTLSGDCETDYAQKSGKYNFQQAEPVPARVK